MSSDGEDELAQALVGGVDVELGGEVAGLDHVQYAVEREGLAGGDFEGGVLLRTEAAFDASAGGQADDADGHGAGVAQEIGDL